MEPDNKIRHQNQVEETNYEKVDLFFCTKNLKFSGKNNSSRIVIEEKLNDPTLAYNYREIGRTDVVKDRQEAAYEVPIEVQFALEKHQIFRLIVQEITINSTELIGMVEFELSKVISRGEEGKIFKIKKNYDESGEVLVEFKPVVGDYHTLFIDMR